MSPSYYWLAILGMAVATYLTRVLPLTLFQKPIRSVFIKSFLSYIPYSALGAMTFPAIFNATGAFVPSLAGTLAAVLLAWFRPNLSLVAFAAVLVAWITGVLI